MENDPQEVSCALPRAAGDTGWGGERRPTLQTPRPGRLSCWPGPVLATVTLGSLDPPEPAARQRCPPGPTPSLRDPRGTWVNWPKFVSPPQGLQGHKGTGRAFQLWPWVHMGTSVAPSGLLWPPPWTQQQSGSGHRSVPGKLSRGFRGPALCLPVRGWPRAVASPFAPLRVGEVEGTWALSAWPSVCHVAPVPSTAAALVCVLHSGPHPFWHQRRVPVGDSGPDLRWGRGGAVVPAGGGRGRQSFTARRCSPPAVRPCGS